MSIIQPQSVKSTKFRSQKGRTSGNVCPDFSQVGGLAHHIHVLREMVIFPLVYHDVYAQFNIRPPRGVLFHGPPGTGKTLIAGALANECSKDRHGKVHFYSRKGADILDKFVGESEKKLRNIFEQASRTRPSIVFFDEIDALAPTRSSRQDQVHASVVATLLTLMDGIDSKPGIVVIGATNRIDAVDPALRRTGRFDRELYFPLPSLKARREILQVHVSSWPSPPSPNLLDYLADITPGFCGSDLRALCAEAVMCTIRRCFPNIHSSDKHCDINAKDLKVERNDFLTAHSQLYCSGHKLQTPMHQMSIALRPLLSRQLDYIINQIYYLWSHFLDSNFRYVIGDNRYGGRLLIIGSRGQGHNRYIIPAILQCLDHLPSHHLTLQSIYSDDVTPEEACIKKIREARQSIPSILVMPKVDNLWRIVDDSTKGVFLSLLNEINAGLPLLLISTCSIDVPTLFYDCFTARTHCIFTMENPNKSERELYFNPLFLEKALILCNETSDTKNESEACNVKPENKSIKKQVTKRIRSSSSNHPKMSQFTAPASSPPIKRKRCNSDTNTCLKKSNSCISNTNLVKNSFNPYPSTSQCKNMKSMSSKCKICHLEKIRVLPPAENIDNRENKKSKEYITNEIIDFKISSELKIKLEDDKVASDTIEQDSKKFQFNLLHKNFESYTSLASLENTKVIRKWSPNHRISVNESYFSNIVDNQEKKINIDDLIISRPRLLNLFNLAVEKTENSTIDKLELLYDQLDYCITSYMSSLDRNPMLEDIEKILNQFESGQKSVDKQTFFGSNISL